LSDFSEVLECKCAKNCVAVKKILANDRRKKLIHFLMHLNDEYESIRGQILLLDPLPNVNKAYAMIQRVEKQRQVTGGIGIMREVAAAVGRSHSVNNVVGGSEQPPTACLVRNAGRGRRESREEKAARHCNHCKRSGHTADQCFKLIGYPNW